MILHVANPIYDVRLDMNVEDEYIRLIEELDAKILERDKVIAEQNAIIEQNAQISEQADQIKKMAKAMLAAGMSAEDIAKATSMTVGDVESLILQERK